MEQVEVTRDEIIVMADEPGIFRVAIVALNQKHRETGDIKQWLGAPLPLEIANIFASDEGKKRGLPVTIYVNPLNSSSL